ncbi:MAG TPA: SRPBCC family protein [Candidatus Polarisedimenticolia bacterium]|jgi:hypothetical protein|nr:SRPBCC family protein [Candidatus Polarisedimenticolia bacterium]
MRTFDVQSVGIERGAEDVFAYLADAATLPRWTSAFKTVSGGRATLMTPGGSFDVGLEVRASRAQGTVDWVMTFPDGSVAKAYSRVIELQPDRSLYCFVLTSPPVPLELLEGALDQQSRTLRAELERLRMLLGRGSSAGEARR